MDELDALKYQIYKKSRKADYITFKQFKENQKVAYTFSELKQKSKNRLDFNKQKNKNK